MQATYLVVEQLLDLIPLQARSVVRLDGLAPAQTQHVRHDGVAHPGVNGARRGVAEQL
jgi:hypothetical protein